MDTIILIETSTELCSAALARNGEIVSYLESTEPRAHASLTAVFVKRLLDEAGIEAPDCSAVCVSMGPGSYTGLRVGVSTAKGLCFGAGIPLIATGTLDTLAWQAVSGSLLPDGCKYIIPMIDARRMEVYTAPFSPDCRQLEDTAPLIIGADSFSSYLDPGIVFLESQLYIHPHTAFRIGMRIKVQKRLISLNGPIHIPQCDLSCISRKHRLRMSFCT